MILTQSRLLFHRTKLGLVFFINNAKIFVYEL